jgi:hypothetical protein
MKFSRGWYLLALLMSFVIAGTFFIGCDDDDDNSPTEPDPTVTPAPQDTPTPAPTPPPTSEPTSAPDAAEVYRGRSYRGDTGELLGEIEYTIYPDRTVTGSLQIWRHCTGPYPPVHDEFVTLSFSTTADPDRRFYYHDEAEWPSPHYNYYHTVECQVGGESPSGQWESSNHTNDNWYCSGNGTWIAWREQ